MKLTRISTAGLLMGLFLLAAPQRVGAEGIKVTPEGWDYGTVPVGESSTKVFKMESTEPVPLTIQSVTIDDDVTGSFTIVSSSPPPSVMLFQGESIEVTVQFAPTGPGAHSANLHILSDAEPPDTILDLPLSGDGGATPSELMVDVLVFLEASVADGSLYGAGCSWWAHWRVEIFTRWLNVSAWLIDTGRERLACCLLHVALGPPDLVAGPAREELASMIQDVLDALGCP